jgi:hypothetical protein
MKDEAGKNLFKGLAGNLALAKPEDQQRILRFLKQRFSKLDMDPRELCDAGGLGPRAPLRLVFGILGRLTKSRGVWGTGQRFFGFGFGPRTVTKIDVELPCRRLEFATNDAWIA